MATVVLVVMTMAIYASPSLPGRETDHIGIELLGYTPPPCPVDYGPYPDYYVNMSGQGP